MRFPGARRSWWWAAATWPSTACGSSSGVGFEEARSGLPPVAGRDARRRGGDRDAEEEGVKFHYLIAPETDPGQRRPGHRARMHPDGTGAPDGSGRRKTGYYSRLRVRHRGRRDRRRHQGQEGEVSCLCNLPGVESDERGIIRVDENLMSSRRGIFAGGDCVSGPDTLIGACAHGRLVGLKKIARYSKKRPSSRWRKSMTRLSCGQLNTVAAGGHRTMPAGLRKSRCDMSRPWSGSSVLSGGGQRLYAGRGCGRGRADATAAYGGRYLCLWRKSVRP